MNKSTGLRGAVRAATVVGIGLVIGVILGGCASGVTTPDTRRSEPVPVDAADAVGSGDRTRSEAPAHAEISETEKLLVSLARGDEIAVIDPALPEAKAVAQRIRVGAAPWGIGVASDGRTAYAATAEGLAVVDLAAGERTALVQYQHPAPTISSGEYRPGGLGLAVSPDGARVYVAVTTGSTDSGSSTLEVFDTEAGSFIGSVPVGLRPFDVLVAPDGAWAATVDHDGFTVTVVDTETLEPAQYTVAPFGTEGGLASWEKPHYGAVDAEGMIWLPYQGLEVAKLDPRTGKYTTMPSAANSHSHGTALAGNRLLTVGTGAFGNADGEANLSILDLRTGREEIVPLDPAHETVTAWTDAAGSEYAAVAGGNTRDAGWDGITMIELDSHDERRIPVPDYPQSIVAFAPSV